MYEANIRHKITVFKVHDPYCGDSNKLLESTGLVNVSPRKCWD